MKVFVSWSGEVSHSVAEALYEWLPSVIQTLEPFLSSNSIEKGSRWAVTLSEGLADSAFGIICLTRENLASPWMTFEAGALSEGLSASHVCPLLVDIDRDEVRGPLAEFQSTRLDREDMFKLIATINRASGEQAIDPNRVAKLFDALWPEFETTVNAALIAHASAQDAAAADTPTSRTFKFLATRGTLINPSDQSRNIAFKVETINNLLGSLAKALEGSVGQDDTREIFEEAGYQAALAFGERIREKWGLDFPEDSLADRVERWCTFDSDVGWGRLVNELTIDDSSESVCGAIRLLDNFQTYKRSGNQFSDCYLMHGYVRGVLEALCDGTPLSVTCDLAECPLLHRRKRDCVFLVRSADEANQ